MAEEWGPWIEHDGRGCPLPLGIWVRVFVEHFDGVMFESEVPCDPKCKNWDWRNFCTPGVCSDGTIGLYARILRYRIRKLSALTLLERIASDPQPLPEGVEA